MKKKLCTAVAAAVLTVTAPAFALEHLDAFYYNTADSFIAELSHSLQAQAKAEGTELHEFNAMDDLLVQLESIQTAAGKGKQPLAVNIVDVSNGQAAADIAKKNGNALIFFNRMPSAEVLASWEKACYVGSDAAQSGTLQGKMLADYTAAHPEADRNHDGKLSLVLIKGQATHQDTALRTNAALKALREAGVNAEITFSQNGNWSFASGSEQMGRALSSQGIEKIEAVICNNDAMALGASAALQQLGWNMGDPAKFVPIVGIDGLPEALKAVQDGKLLGTVKQDAKAQAELIFKLARILDEGKAVPAELDGIKASGRAFEVPYQTVIKQ